MNMFNTTESAFRRIWGKRKTVSCETANNSVDCSVFTKKKKNIHRRYNFVSCVEILLQDVGVTCLDIGQGHDEAMGQRLAYI